MKASADAQLKTFGILTSIPAGYAAILALVSIWIYSKGDDREREKKADGLLGMGVSLGCFMLAAASSEAICKVQLQYSDQPLLNILLCVILSCLDVAFSLGFLISTPVGIGQYCEGIAEEYQPVYGQPYN